MAAGAKGGRNRSGGRGWGGGARRQPVRQRPVRRRWQALPSVPPTTARRCTTSVVTQHLGPPHRPQAPCPHRCFLENSRLAPQQPSTCTQMPWRRQMSTMGRMGSNAPVTVVPAVSPTKKGACAGAGRGGQRGGRGVLRAADAPRAAPPCQGAAPWAAAAGVDTALPPSSSFHPAAAPDHHHAHPALGAGRPDRRLSPPPAAPIAPGRALPDHPSPPGPWRPPPRSPPPAPPAASRRSHRTRPQPCCLSPARSAPQPLSMSSATAPT